MQPCCSRPAAGQSGGAGIRHTDRAPVQRLNPLPPPGASRLGHHLQRPFGRKGTLICRLAFVGRLAGVARPKQGCLGCGGGSIAARRRPADASALEGQSAAPPCQLLVLLLLFNLREGARESFISFAPPEVGRPTRPAGRWSAAPRVRRSRRPQWRLRRPPPAARRARIRRRQLGRTQLGYPPAPSIMMVSSSDTQVAARHSSISLPRGGPQSADYSPQRRGRRL